jgi:hypothetical protein
MGDAADADEQPPLPEDPQVTAQARMVEVDAELAQAVQKLRQAIAAGTVSPKAGDVLATQWEEPAVRMQENSPPEAE